MNMGPKEVHEKVLEKILRVQRIIDQEKQALKRAIAEAQTELGEETWNEHSREALFLALKDAQMRNYGERLIIDGEEDEV